MPEAYAALAACCFAAASIAVKKGSQGTSILAGLIVSLACGSIVAVVAYVITGPEPVAPTGVAVFAGAGILGQLTGRATGMIGIGQMGPSRSIPIQGSLYPIAGIGFGVLLLGEEPSLLQFAGVSVVTAGIWVLAREEAQKTDPELGPGTTSRVNIPPILFPLAAGLAFGGADLLRKEAISIEPDAMLGVMVEALTGLSVAVFVALMMPPARSRLTFDRGAAWFGLAGVLGTIAALSVIHALLEADLSVVTPIVASQPLPVLILSSLFLKRLETVTFRIVVGGLAVVVGTILISVSH